MLQTIINKLENEKNHNNNDKHTREEDHPVIENNVFYFFANYS